MRIVPGNVTAAAAALFLSAAWPAAVQAADSVADFYRGKSIIMLVPDAPGGGYDTYGRLVAQFIGQHIPGNPNVVPQNMPGAGGITEINHLFNAAPKDGTTIGMIEHGLIFSPIFDPREVRYNIDGFRWFGSVTPITMVGVFRKDAPVQTVADLFDREVIIGGSGGTTIYLPLAINNILNTKMKLVQGYTNTNDSMLAMARQEVSGVVGIGVDSLQGSRAGGGVDYKILFQMGAARDRSLSDVPLIQEFAKSDEDRAALEAIFSSFSIGRVFVAPMIPEERYVALQAAFEATVKDPAFVEQARKQHANVSYISPDEIQNIIHHVYGEPEAILTRARAAIQEGH
jgi:tripartite-type tricarboxylate transporter receptor subunit TctC